MTCEEGLSLALIFVFVCDTASARKRGSSSAISFQQRRRPVAAVWPAGCSRNPWPTPTSRSCSSRAFSQPASAPSARRPPNYQRTTPRSWHHLDTMVDLSESLDRILWPNLPSPPLPPPLSPFLLPSPPPPLLTGWKKWQIRFLCRTS